MTRPGNGRPAFAVGAGVGLFSGAFWHALKVTAASRAAKQRLGLSARIVALVLEWCNVDELVGIRNDVDALNAGLTHVENQDGEWLFVEIAYDAGGSIYPS